jgi:hypothetical protein
MESDGQALHSAGALDTAQFAGPISYPARSREGRIGARFQAYGRRFAPDAPAAARVLAPWSAIRTRCTRHGTWLPRAFNRIRAGREAWTWRLATVDSTLIRMPIVFYFLSRVRVDTCFATGGDDVRPLELLSRIRVEWVGTFGRRGLSQVIIDGYVATVLLPQLESLGLSKRQREIVAGDVRRRLGSLLAHWGNAEVRRALLVLAAEEASFWEPRTASLEIRSVVLLGIRNSLIEDLGTSRPYTKELRSAKKRLSDDCMPRITGEAIKYFHGTDLDGLVPAADQDLFGDLPRRFPVAWRVLSVLGQSNQNEIVCDLPAVKSEARDLHFEKSKVEQHAVVASGIDPRLDSHLIEMLRLVKEGELSTFFSPSFKSITRNPNKLLSIIDHVLRHSGSVLTPNYLLSTTYLARRNPLLRPIHYTSELDAQLEDMTGLSERHRNALASLVS